MPGISENAVGKLVQEKGRLLKDRVFLFFKDEKITYEQLDHVSNAFANGLQDMGIQKDDKLAIMMRNHPNFLYAWLVQPNSGRWRFP